MAFPTDLIRTLGYSVKKYLTSSRARLFKGFACVDMALRALPRQRISDFSDRELSAGPIE